MRTLSTPLRPTAEQATIIDDNSPGYWLIRGAAGSGKTTTSLLRLNLAARYWRDRRQQLGLPGPVRILVMTFNRTLRGYIEKLAREQIKPGPDVKIEITTFGAWSRELTGAVVLDHDPRAERIRQLASGHVPGWQPRFLVDEVDYILGRFLQSDRISYLDARREGRGGTPRVERPVRLRLLSEVIEPFQDWKRERGLADWADLAVDLAENRRAEPYDVAIIDETQDFSANQIRAIQNHLAKDFTCTFVRDNTQRIYANAFRWAEVGIQFGGQSRRLQKNYRNTKQIAAFARPLVDGLEAVEDESLPDFKGCTREGRKPSVLLGRYSDQLDWVVDYLENQVSSGETVAFLHPMGWFKDLRYRLDREGIKWESLTRESEWPDDDNVTVGLCTMHSAKGLEFDHVIIIGYNAQVVQHGGSADDALRDAHRRLLAMSAGRARTGLVLGYKPTDASDLVGLLADGTFERVDL
jgi:superfamily I DNA/RNA helicase